MKRATRRSSTSTISSATSTINGGPQQALSEYEAAKKARSPATGRTTDRVLQPRRCLREREPSAQPLEAILRICRTSRKMICKGVHSARYADLVHSRQQRLAAKLGGTLPVSAGGARPEPTMNLGADGRILRTERHDWQNLRKEQSCGAFTCASVSLPSGGDCVPAFAFRLHSEGTHGTSGTSRSKPDVPSTSVQPVEEPVRNPIHQRGNESKASLPPAPWAGPRS